MDLKEAKHTAWVVRQLEDGQPNRALDALDWALGEIDRLERAMRVQILLNKLEQPPHGPDFFAYFRNSAMLSEATASAALAASGDADGTGSVRDPVGWELDLENDDFWGLVADKEGYFQKGGIKDEILKRIRPTYECKECANWKAHAAAIEDSSFDMIKRINLARAALDGAGFTEQVAEQARKVEDLEQRVAVVTQAKQHLNAARAALEGE